MAPHHTSALDPAQPLSFSGPDPVARQRFTREMLAQARPLMERVVETTRQALQSRQDQARTPGESHAMREARQELVRLAPVMGERFPDALHKAAEQHAVQAEDKPSRSLFTIHFDELELMDEAQVNESVERARARQLLVTAVEGPLADLDGLVCAVLGLARVQPEQNPLRPDIFLQALQSVVSQMQVSPQVRHDWMGAMAQALGQELRALYRTQIDQLKQSGVKPVGYAMRQTDGQVVYVPPTEGAAAPGFASDNELAAAGTGNDHLLTLDRLRRLLLGEFSGQGPAVQGAAGSPGPAAAAAVPSTPESFSDRFAREFEDPQPLPSIDAPATDFAMTVPAAFEALQEMNQVGRMMERLGAPRPAPEAPRQQVQALGQALSMEVVSLMVDNIARDSRLLWPVQQFIRALEPALMQLALADPRFFSNKDHPARRLLQDITDQSLAFNSTEAAGFQSFMRSLMNIAGPLATATIEGQDDFEQVLEQLHAKWAEKEKARKEERLRAIEALQHAERRHLLAAQISREIWLLPDIGKVPDAVSRFLLGPWSQVMAEARLTDTSGSADPGRYHELVEALIWSAQPELTRANTGQLARLLPKLLAKLREGLASIDYPAERTEAVFELLMQLHQQAFKPGPRAAAPIPAAVPPAQEPSAAEPESASPQSALQEEDEPWVAPAEARESGFMDMEEATAQSSASGSPLPDATTSPPGGEPPIQPQLGVGMWVNLQVAGQWERTQLSWIGSHGNLFLFTSASGRTQSMTLRLVERLIQQGSLQVLSEHAIVDGALDAVAQAAMRNSVESQL